MAHDHPDRAPFGWYWEQGAGALGRIMASGGWSVHDVINRPDIRWAVSEQWRLTRAMQRHREMNTYFQYLEYLEAISRASRT